VLLVLMYELKFTYYCNVAMKENIHVFSQGGGSNK
jgi:hypothetical protein